MNAIHDVIAHVNDSPDSAGVLRIAMAVASEHGARLSAVYAVDPTPLGAFISAEAAAVAEQVSVQERRERELRARAGAEPLLGGAPLTVEHGEALQALTARSLSADLLVVAQGQDAPPAGHGRELPEKLLMAAGCPLLIVPRQMSGRKGALPSAGHRVLVAWAPKRECARALRDALPLLQRAAAVELLHMGGESPRTAPLLMATQAHLQRHGVACTLQRHEIPVADAVDRVQRDTGADAQVAHGVLLRAAEIDADLVVMGGYGRPRALEWILGGVTRSMLRAMNVPLLMAH
ncbi:MAG: universal stress protein [Rubrivivax sp.]|nr:universal stress protein [Rubrivivax sp.]